MRTSTLIAAALFGFATTVAMSQETSRDSSMQQQQMQPGKNAPSSAAHTGDSLQGGMQSGSPGSGTLMEHREQGMSPNTSPNSRQEPQSTGKIKQ